MKKSDELNELLRESNNELKESLIKIYGNPSYDEMLKLSAMDDLFNMPLSLKRFYLRYYGYLKKLVSDADYEENKLTTSQRIDYNLTLIKLLSMYGSKVIDNYCLFYEVENAIDGNFLLKSIGDLFVLLEAFNKIEVSEYSKYDDLFFNRAFINRIYPKDYINSNEAIKMISHNLDYSIKKYSQNYNIYNDDNRKKLIKSIRDDIDARKRVF